MVQSELWKALDSNSRRGSTIATSLADAGMIDRVETVHQGQVTYDLQPVDTGAETPDSENEPTRRPDDGSDETQEDTRDPAERRQQALELIIDSNGLYQSELWKELDVSSRTGSRIATALAEEGAIEREETVYNGQRTYLLKPPAKELDFSLLMAGDQLSPFIASDEIDPQSPGFSQWVLNLESTYQSHSE